jgi:CRP/FNR family transcriptional regulator, dissimilatory nitrate respiration regulator
MNFADLYSLPLELKSVTRTRYLDRGEVLFLQTDRADAIFILEFGSILILNEMPAGERAIHYLVKAGELLAELALFHTTYPYTAIATESVRVIVVPKQAYLQALARSPEFTTTTLAQFARRLSECELLLELRGIRSASQRVLRYLQLQARSNEKTIALDRPFKEIAIYLGLTPEAFSRALTRLQRLGQIKRDRHQITFY